MAAGCTLCGGPLHEADYARKPRGLPASSEEFYNHRFSLCCARCRKRSTPPSVRFLGRKVYVAVSVLIISVVCQGRTGSAARKLREELLIDRRTLRRWQRWWRESFAKSLFWRSKQGCFARPILSESLPLGLLDRFTGDAAGRVVALLRFIAPVTTGTGATQDI
jgi:hypothetical protein